MAERYENAATVSDEHGKGSEILRQQAYTFSSNGNHVVYYAEVDTIIRSIVVIRRGSGAAAILHVQKRGPGSATTDIVPATTLDAAAAPRYIGTELPLVVERNIVKKGESVEMIGSGTHTDYSVHFNWMPDMWSADADARTY